MTQFLLRNSVIIRLEWSNKVSFLKIKLTPKVYTHIQEGASLREFKRD